MVVARCRSAAGRVSLALVAGLLSACGDTTGPNQGGSVRVERITEWVMGAAFRQVGDFEYDAAGRLIRYLYSHDFPDLVWRSTIRVDYVYRADGRMLGHDRFLHLPGSTWAPVQTLRYTYGSWDRPSGAEIESVDEQGHLRTETRSYAYDDDGRLVEETRGDVTISYNYDEDGNVERDVTSYPWSELVLTMQHSDVLNPFSGLPPALDIVLMNGLDVLSRHMAVAAQSGVVGQAPAARATGTLKINRWGYPARREWTFWNVSDPDATRTVVITEFDYGPAQ